MNLKSYLILSILFLLFSFKNFAQPNLILLEKQPDTISIVGNKMDDPKIVDTDVFPIHIYNIKTRAPIIIDSTISLFFDDRKIDFIYGDHIQAKDLPDPESNTRIKIELTYGNFDYTCNIHSSAFKEFSIMIFHLNFDYDYPVKCNYTYTRNDNMETNYTITTGLESTSIKRKDCIGSAIQTLQIKDTYGVGGNDEFLENYMYTAENSYAHLNGKYSTAINATDSVKFELKDYAKLLVTIFNSNEILREEKGEWIYYSDYNSIDFDLNKGATNKIKFQQKNDTLDLIQYGLLPSELDPSLLTLTTYHIKNGKVKKSDLLHLKKE